MTQSARAFPDIILRQDQIEVHLVGSLAEEHVDWRERDEPPRPPPFAVSAADGLVLAAVESPTGRLRRVDDHADADFAFQVVLRQLNCELAMAAWGKPPLLNGDPAGPLAALTAGDSLVLSPGMLSYVTVRYQPYIGSPPEEFIGKKCPKCRLPIKPDTRIVTHRCGTPYHLETTDSHPHLSKDERLECFLQVHHCLVCRKAMSEKPYLTWDPWSV